MNAAEGIAGSNGSAGFTERINAHGVIHGIRRPGAAGSHLENGLTDRGGVHFPDNTGCRRGHIHDNRRHRQTVFCERITIPALRAMQTRFGAKIYGRYSFVDAFNPNTGWVNPDVIGIDIGVTLLSAENLRSGHVWQWFMRNPEIAKAYQAAGLTQAR